MSIYDWSLVAAMRDGGETWETIAEGYGTSASTVRKAWSRHVVRKRAEEPEPGCRILGFDIETAPNTAHVWGAYKQNISPSQIMKTGRVMCFAYRWFHDDPIREPVMFESEQGGRHEEMIEEAHRLLDEADAVVHYNGSRFDVPTLNREFLKLGMSPPSPYRQIDLLKVARKQFRFVSNRLDHLLRDLDIGEKVRHDGHEMWVRCMAGDAEAWERMEEYNRVDVSAMEKLYRRMLPWIDSHPNLALYVEGTTGPTCPKCGSDKLHRRGYYRTVTRRYQRWQCITCGGWSRTRYSEGAEDPRNILTGAK